MQARLKRIEARLAVVREEAALASVGAMLPPAVASAEVPTSFPGMFYDGADRRPEVYSPAPPKRKASDLSRNLGDSKRFKSTGFGISGGDAGGDQRLLPNGRLRSAYLNCEKIMDILIRDQASMAYFNVPVDHIALGAITFLWLLFVICKSSLAVNEFSKVAKGMLGLASMMGAACRRDSALSTDHHQSNGLGNRQEQVLSRCTKLKGQCFWRQHGASRQYSFKQIFFSVGL
jgi:hypothetical protein